MFPIEKVSEAGDVAGRQCTGSACIRPWLCLQHQVKGVAAHPCHISTLAVEAGGSEGQTTASDTQGA